MARHAHNYSGHGVAIRSLNVHFYGKSEKLEHETIVWNYCIKSHSYQTFITSIKFEYCSTLYREGFICIIYRILKNYNLNTRCYKNYSKHENELLLNQHYMQNSLRALPAFIKNLYILPYPTWEKGKYLLKCRCISYETMFATRPGIYSYSSM